MTSLVLLYRFWSSFVYNESSSVRGERCFSKLGAFMTHNATSPDHWRHFIDWVTLQMWPAALKISQFIDYLFFTPHKVQQSNSKLCRLTAVGTGNKFWFCIVQSITVVMPSSLSVHCIKICFSDSYAMISNSCFYTANRGVMAERKETSSFEERPFKVC